MRYGLIFWDESSIELKIYIYLHHLYADVAKLVDASDLGSGAFGRGGSSPSIRTVSICENIPLNQGDQVLAVF